MSPGVLGPGGEGQGESVRLRVDGRRHLAGNSNRTRLAIVEPVTMNLTVLDDCGSGVIEYLFGDVLAESSVL